MQFLRCVCQIFIDGRLLKYLSGVFIYRIYLSVESIFMCLAVALFVALSIFPRQCLSHNIPLPATSIHSAAVWGIFPCVLIVSISLIITIYPLHLTLVTYLKHLLYLSTPSLYLVSGICLLDVTLSRSRSNTHHWSLTPILDHNHSLLFLFFPDPVPQITD